MDRRNIRELAIERLKDGRYMATLTIPAIGLLVFTEVCEQYPSKLIDRVQREHPTAVITQH